MMRIKKSTWNKIIEELKRVHVTTRDYVSMRARALRLLEAIKEESVQI